MAIKLVDMARTPVEMKAMHERYDSPVNPEAPEYPWGLTINLGKDELEKLGITDMPDVGQEVPISAMGKITGVNMSAIERDGGEESRSVTIQITALGVEVETDDDDVPVATSASKLYGK